MFEVYLDGEYYTHFGTEAEAQTFCENHNWQIIDEEYGFAMDLCYREVVTLDDAIMEPSGALLPVTSNGNVIRPTQYYVLINNKWHVEYKDESGTVGYLTAKEYNMLDKEQNGGKA